MSCSCQWYRVCDAGALRAEPLATLMSCAVKNIKFAHQGSTNGMSTTRVRRYIPAIARLIQEAGPHRRPAAVCMSPVWPVPCV